VRYTPSWVWRKAAWVSGLCVGGRQMKKRRRVDLESIYRDNPKLIAEHLNAALARRDRSAVVKAIGEMIRAQGGSRFSRKSRLERASIYRSFSGKMSPRLDRALDALSALDVKLVVKAK
jgi:probable addiction module antidote protein